MISMKKMKRTEPLPYSAHLENKVPNMCQFSRRMGQLDFMKQALSLSCINGIIFLAVL